MFQEPQSVSTDDTSQKEVNDEHSGASLNTAGVPLLKFGHKPVLLRGFQSLCHAEQKSRDPLSERLIVHEYLDALRDTSIPTPLKSTPYWDLLVQLAQTFRPMQANCRVSVNVPVHNEENCLGRFLQSYLRQTSDTWEMNILINGRRGYQRDASEQIAEEYRAAYEQRGITLNISSIEFDESHGFEGYARRILSDLALLRSVSRNDPTHTLYIKLEDADNFEHHKDLLTAGIKQLDDTPQLDCVVHDFEYDPFILSAHHGILFERTVSVLTERKFFASLADLCENPVTFGQELPARYRKFRLLTSGCTTLASAESIALVGGAFEGLPRMSELIYGEKVSILRGTATSDSVRLCYDSIGRLPLGSYSDARRGIKNLSLAIRKGTMCFDPYSDYGEHQAESSLRDFIQLRELDNETLAPFRRLTLEEPERAMWFCQMVLDYQTYLFRLFTPDSGMYSRVLYRYCEFLNSALCGGQQIFEVSDSRVCIANLEGLLGTIRDLRNLALTKAVSGRMPHRIAASSSPTES